MAIYKFTDTEKSILIQNSDAFIRLQIKLHDLNNISILFIVRIK